MLSEIRRIDAENYYPSDDDVPIDINIPKRLHPIIYVLIINNYATLKEIKEYYTIDDVLDLYESYRINSYNKKMAIDAIDKRR